MATEGVKNEPRPSDAPAVPSTERVVTYPPIPAPWLDHLLTAYCKVRPDMPLDDAMRSLLGVAREILDDAAFGVCVPRSGLYAVDSQLPPHGSGAPPSFDGQLIVRLGPPGALRPLEADPTRLFPEFASERVLAILPDHSATLHGASDDERLFVEGSPGSLLLERLALLLASHLENKSALDRSMRDLRAQVIQSDKLASLGQIAAGIVHELNNPLTTIVAYSDFLRRKLVSRGEPADVERLARINEAADRILRFSRDLTAYSRPANEVPGPVAIHEIIERALVFCEHELDKTGVNVEREFGNVRPVRGVAGQLTQVFVNLFTNAAHAMREQGGLLCIATAMTRDVDEGVLVTITDDGHGIDDEHRPRIFDPFFTTKTDGSGTGLGLSIVRSIVQSHGGKISVESRDPHGTVFQVELPTAAAPEDD
jgi:signal transduction histidine kinase